ncbi:MAG: phage major capsid protein [Clostridiales bacterium]|nr:phage major capsid protein [Clostridiales bacterium]
MANYENIKLEKGMYATGKSFTQTLEELDPSGNYNGTELENLDAYERQLKRFDIRVNGAGSDVVEKFFKTSDSAALFPEYVARAVRQGMENADILPKIVATTTKIDSLDYRTITSIPDDDEKELKRVSEGAVIPQTVIKTKNDLVKLHKRGRMLVASYEAIRFQRLDLFTVTLKQIGAYIARTQLKDAIDVLSNSGNTQSVATSGTLTYTDLVNFWNSFSPYELNTIIASPDIMQKLLTMTEFRDATAGLNFHASGKLITPLGAELLKSGDVTSGSLIGIDKNCALEMVQAGDIVTEYDKLIDRQLERATITSIAGFSRIFDDASKTLTC